MNDCGLSNIYSASGWCRQCGLPGIADAFKKDYQTRQVRRSWLTFNKMIALMYLAILDKNVKEFHINFEMKNISSICPLSPCSPFCLKEKFLWNSYLLLGCSPWMNFESRSNLCNGTRYVHKYAQVRFTFSKDQIYFTWLRRNWLPARSAWEE